MAIKLEVKEHSKDPEIVEVEEYNVAEMFQLLTNKDERGNRENEFILLGNNIYSTINIQSIKEVE